MVFIVFAVLAGLINYELNQVMYTSVAPSSLFEFSILTVMLPYLVAAVISFIVANVSAQAMRAEEEKQMETKGTETQQKLL